MLPLVPVPPPECIPAVEAAATAGTMNTETDLDTGGCNTASSSTTASPSNQGSKAASTASIATSSSRDNTIELLTPTTANPALSWKFPLPHCLVVDDARMNRKLLGRLIKPCFQQQSFAEDRQVALDFVANYM
jgi:hypothetical protein